jgi:hypothetical protein
MKTREKEKNLRGKKIVNKDKYNYEDLLTYLLFSSILEAPTTALCLVRIVVG